MNIPLLVLMGSGSGLMALAAIRSNRKWKHFWTYTVCVVSGAAVLAAAAFVEQGYAWLTKPDLFWVVLVTLCVVAVCALPWEYRRWRRIRSKEVATSREEF